MTVIWSDQDRQVCLSALNNGAFASNSVDKAELALIAIGRPRSRPAILRFLHHHKELQQPAWGDEASEICLSSWRAGASYGIIIQKLMAIGVIKSRSAVAGFLNRRRAAATEKLPARVTTERLPWPIRTPRVAGAPARRSTVSVKSPKSKPQSELQSRLANAPVAAARPQSTIYTRDDDGCTFPIGDQPPYTYCNQQQIKGYSFCADHCKTVYRP